MQTAGSEAEPVSSREFSAVLEKQLHGRPGRRRRLPLSGSHEGPHSHDPPWGLVTQPLQERSRLWLFYCEGLATESSVATTAIVVTAAAAAAATIPMDAAVPNPKRLNPAGAAGGAWAAAAVTFAVA